MLSAPHVPSSSHKWASKVGGRGDASPEVENQRGTSRQRLYFCTFFDTYENFAFYTIFKIKWPKFEEKLNFWGRWVWVPMNPSPPQTKLRGDAPVLTPSSFPVGRWSDLPLFSHHRRSPSAGGQIFARRRKRAERWVVDEDHPEPTRPGERPTTQLPRPRPRPVPLYTEPEPRAETRAETRPETWPETRPETAAETQQQRQSIPEAPPGYGDQIVVCLFVGV